MKQLRSEQGKMELAQPDEMGVRRRFFPAVESFGGNYFNSYSKMHRVCSVSQLINNAIRLKSLQNCAYQQNSHLWQITFCLEKNDEFGKYLQRLDPSNFTDHLG